jgi:phospholipid/cholesterol/gamma-HCH transport system substrate-binding protein
MAAKAQNIRVGLFAAATLALFGVVLVVFGGLRFWEKSDHYRIVFATSVIGLESGAEVYMNGIKVGTVAAIEVAPEDIRKVAVAIKVKQGTPIHADTRALLQYAGITGLKVIDLRDGTSASPALPPGGQIAVGEGLLDRLEAQAQTLATQSTELMKRAGEVMQRASTLTDNLIAVTEPARVAAENLAAMSGALKGMVDENRAALHQSLAAITQAAHGATALLDSQVAPLFANAGDFVTGLKKLLVANEGPLRAAVFDLRQASRSIKELARDVRQKPSRLLFSSQPSERKLP